MHVRPKKKGFDWRNQTDPRYFLLIFPQKIKKIKKNKKNNNNKFKKKSKKITFFPCDACLRW